ncbi:MAG: gliding motility-associated C-terminal domain-containing protein [Paludibacteraceae bacterium]|nr:gliding motility-associated C-terminal domain-containing protein [Paludibacteraceae bacterium]
MRKNNQLLVIFIVLFCFLFGNVTARESDQVFHVKCFGGSDGKIVFTPSHGASNTYSWSTGNTTNAVGGLVAGEYTLTVTGTDAGTYTYTITQPEELKILNGGNIVSNTAWGIDNTGNNGEMHLDVQGGTAPYSYLINDLMEPEFIVQGDPNGANPAIHKPNEFKYKPGKDLTGLVPGDYEVLVTDSNKCTATSTFTVVDNAMSYFGDNNSKDMKVCYKETAGHNINPDERDCFPVRIVWDHDVNSEKVAYWYVLKKEIVDKVLKEVWGQRTVTYVEKDENGKVIYNEDGTPKTYTKQEDYTSSSKLKVVERIDVIKVVKNGVETEYRDTIWGVRYPTVISQNMFGGAYRDLSQSAPDNSGYKIILSRTPNDCSDGGTSTTKYAKTLIVTEESFEPIYADSLGVRTAETTLEYVKAGAIETASNLATSDLEPGEHIYYFYTANGKGYRLNWSIKAPPNPVTIHFEQTNCVCHGDTKGTIIAKAQGSWMDYGSANLYYRYELFDITNKKQIGKPVVGKAEAKFIGLRAGIYQIKATDREGCSQTQTVDIREPNEPMSITFNKVKDASCPFKQDGKVMLSIQHGTPPFKFIWEHGSEEQDLVDVMQGEYTVTAIDANGCMATDSTSVDASRRQCLYNIVTPNGDGKNDYFDLTDFANGQNMHVQCNIFDNNGRLVGQLNDENLKWDPLTDGYRPPTGQPSTYTAFIRLYTSSGQTIAELGESFSVIYTK